VIEALDLAGSGNPVATCEITKGKEVSVGKHSACKTD